eukprot:6248161-Prymnesium_polylepis.1
MPLHAGACCPARPHAQRRLRRRAALAVRGGLPGQGSTDCNERRVERTTAFVVRAARVRGQRHTRQGGGRNRIDSVRDALLRSS